MGIGLVLRKTAAAYRNAFGGLPAAVWVLALVLLINRAGSMVLPFLALYVKNELGYPEDLAALTIAFYGVGSLLGNYLGGWLTRLFGAYRVQFWSLVLNGVGYAILSQVRTYGVFAGTLVLVTVAAEILRPANATSVTAACTPLTLRRGFALNRLAVNLGFTIGPMVGGILAAFSYQWLFWGDAATCLMAALALARWLPAEAKVDPPLESHHASGGRSPWRDVNFLVFLGLTLVTFSIFFQLTSTFSLYLESAYGLKTWQIGSLMAVNTVIIVLFEMVLVHAIEPLNVLWVIAVGSFLMCAGFAVLLFGAGYWIGFLSVVVWTVGEMLAMPQAMAFAGQRSGGPDRPRYIAAYTMAVALSFITASLLGSYCYHLHRDLIWVVSGVAACLVLCGYFWLIRAERSAAEITSTSAGSR